MDITNKVFWQQAAGDTDRNYVSICIEWGVILNGPGYAGKYPDCVSKLQGDGTSKKKVTDLRRFADEMKDGDIVVLRLGTSRVHAVGTIVGDYFYSDLFADIDGWDLQHVRRVRWHWTSLEHPKEFDIYEMKQGDTTQLLTSAKVQRWVGSVEETFEKLVDLPDLGDDIDFDQISDHLFNKGVDISSIKGLSDQIGNLVTLAKWYQRNKMTPSENETLAYLTVPLLSALGWSPQKMAIEWNNIDIALFGSLPRQDSNLMIVVEGKRIGTSSQKAVNQAIGYATPDERKKCKKVVVTDGLRYSIFMQKNGGFGANPIAYLNLTEFKRSYPIYRCDGAAEALFQLAEV